MWKCNILTWRLGLTFTNKFALSSVRVFNIIPPWTVTHILNIMLYTSSKRHNTTEPLWKILLLGCALAWGRVYPHCTGAAVAWYVKVLGELWLWPNPITSEQSMEGDHVLPLGRLGGGLGDPWRGREAWRDWRRRCEVGLRCVGALETSPRAVCCSVWCFESSASVEERWSGTETWRRLDNIVFIPFLIWFKEE